MLKAIRKQIKEKHLTLKDVMTDYVVKFKEDISAHPGLEYQGKEMF